MRSRYVLLAALLSLAASAGAQQSGTRAQPASDTATTVTASRREVRVVFPREDAERWGWSADTNVAYNPFYGWSVLLDGMDGPQILQLFIGRRAVSAYRFPSLDSLVAAGEPQLCATGMMLGPCKSAHIAAFVEDQHVVLVMRDSVAIGRLFRLRPATVQTWRSRPTDTPRFAATYATVEYVEPQIPIPDSAALAEARASRRRYEASISHISRTIHTDNGGFGDAIWIAVGDSTTLEVQESSCHHDSCTARPLWLDHSYLSVDDSSVARVRAASAQRANRFFDGSAKLFGRRPGRTRVHVALPPMASDTAPSSVPPARMLERDVVVTRRLARLDFLPRSATINAGGTVTVRLRAIDVNGRVHAKPPARIEVKGEERSYATSADDPMRFSFSSPGRHTVIATLGALSDTLTIRVLPAP